MAARRSPRGGTGAEAVARHRRIDRRHADGRDPAARAEPGRPAVRQARGRQPDRLGQGSRRPRADRGPRGERPAAARLDPARGDLGQHRHRARDDRAAQGLPRGRRDARQRHPRAAPARRAARRGDHRFARRARLERRDRAGARPRGAGSAVRDGRPVREPGQSPRPRGDDRARRCSKPSRSSTCSWPGSGPGARSRASGGSCGAPSRGVRIVAAEPLPGESVQGLRSLDDGLRARGLRPVAARRPVRGRPTATLSRRRGSCSSGKASSPARRPARSCGSRRGSRRSMERGTIVALLPDGGWKYLSTGHVLAPARRDGGRRSRAGSPGGERSRVPDPDAYYPGERAGRIRVRRRSRCRPRSATRSSRTRALPSRTRPAGSWSAIGPRRKAARARAGCRSGTRSASPVPLRDRSRRPAAPDDRDR